MASPVDICNAGLAHIGARAQIAAISPPDGSVEAGHCARFYAQARRELLEAFPWGFAKTRVTLAEVTNTSTVWLYAYAVPADCITPLRVLPLSTEADEAGSADFEREGDVLLTNEPEAALVYKRDVTDSSKFTPLFTTSLGMLMASFVAGPIIKGIDGAKIAAQWRQAAYDVAANAAAKAANGTSETSEFTPSSIAAR